MRGIIFGEDSEADCLLSAKMGLPVGNCGQTGAKRRKGSAMIDEIHVKNLALIAEASLAPVAGMTVITGETGAGKTALLSAIKLLVGERADATMVRDGADALVVEGRFFSGDDADEGTVVSRRVSADGRSRVNIDGSLSSVAELAAGVGSTVDLCGQHEHQLLLKTVNHVRMLDVWAKETIEAPRAAYREALDAALAASAELARVRESTQASSVKLEEARFMLARIDEVAPKEGEYEALLAQLPKRENAEALAQATHAAHQAIAKDDGALDAIARAVSVLEAMAQVDSALSEQATALREAAFVLEDVSRDVRAYSESVDFDPEELAVAQDRVAALQGVMRSFGPGMEEVFAHRAEAADLIALVDDSQQHIDAALRAADEAEQVLADAAQKLTDARVAAAPRFAEAVRTQMARLEMGSTELVVELTPLERSAWTKIGPDHVEFMFRAGAGMQVRPLARIASGGEVSRVMLAIKVVLGQTDEVATLVFDEVDAGVGGATAVALAEVLADLASTHQLIVVTHLAQVAVAADAHYRVEKQETAEGIPQTRLQKLVGDSRVAEVARMLSGDTSPVSLRHAENMLAHRFRS
ncbi:MAG: DNA repair protein RecN [Raoultibacter sp.]